MTKYKKTKKCKDKDSKVECEYFEDVVLTNPITGIKETHKVKIVRYKSIGEKSIGNKGVSSELDEFEYCLNSEDENDNEDESDDN